MLLLIVTPIDVFLPTFALQNKNIDDMVQKTTKEPGSSGDSSGLKRKHNSGSKKDNKKKKAKAGSGSEDSSSRSVFELFI